MGSEMCIRDSYKIEQIQDRYNLTNWILENDINISQYQIDFESIPDLERSLSRISLSRGGPRDLSLMSKGLLIIKGICENLISKNKVKSISSLLNAIIDNLDIDYSLFSKIKNAFKTDVPLIVKEGNFIKEGFHKELDSLRNFRNNELEFIAKLQKKYSELTKVNSLKIKHNRMLGYLSLIHI